MQDTYQEMFDDVKKRNYENYPQQLKNQLESKIDILIGSTNKLKVIFSYIKIDEAISPAEQEKIGNL